MDAQKTKQKITELARAKGLTNQQLADLSGIPVSTVAAIRSPNSPRTPSYDTALRLLSALDADIPEELREKEEMPMTEMLNALITLYERTIKTKNIWIIALTAMLFLLVATVIGILIYDITHPYIGWFQYS